MDFLVGMSSVRDLGAVLIILVITGQLACSFPFLVSSLHRPKAHVDGQSYVNGDLFHHYKIPSHFGFFESS